MRTPAGKFYAYYAYFRAWSLRPHSSMRFNFIDKQLNPTQSTKILDNGSQRERSECSHNRIKFFKMSPSEHERFIRLIGSRGSRFRGGDSWGIDFRGEDFRIIGFRHAGVRGIDFRSTLSWRTGFRGAVFGISKRYHWMYSKTPIILTPVITTPIISIPIVSILDCRGPDHINPDYRIPSNWQAWRARVVESVPLKFNAHRFLNDRCPSNREHPSIQEWPFIVRSPCGVPE